MNFGICRYLSGAADGLAAAVEATPDVGIGAPFSATRASRGWLHSAVPADVCACGIALRGVRVEDSLCPPPALSRPLLEPDLAPRLPDSGKADLNVCGT
jgi:hypothetical protein